MDLITINIDEYEPHPQNPHGHPDAQIAALGKSIDDFDQYKNVVVWRGLILAGHGFVEAARRRGRKTLEAQDMSHLSAEQATALMTADIILPDLATIDNDLLSEVLAGFGDPLDIPGVDVDLLKSIDFGDYGGNGKGEDTPPAIDRAEELRVEWGTELEQLWQLGEHRLVCGNCKDRRAVDRVMGGDKAGLLLADPPYGKLKIFNSSGAVGNAGSNLAQVKHYGAYANHGNFDVKPMLEALEGTYIKSIIWGGNYFTDVLPIVSSWLIWDKRAGKMLFYADCEMAWSDLGMPAKIFNYMWQGMIREGERIEREHPTQKPVPLYEWCLSFTPDAEIILDPTLGSGTTLIACENLNRKCRAIELSPAYVAVALQRWSDHTGEMPRLIED